MSPFAPWSVYRNRVSEGTTVILTLGGIKQHAIFLEKEVANLKLQVESLRELPVLDMHYVGTLKNEYIKFCAGANRFLVEGVWKHIVESVLESAYRNFNRSGHLLKEDWKLLVIDDAMPDLNLVEDGCNAENVELWVKKAIEGYYYLEDHKDGYQFNAFSGLSVLFREEESESAVTDVSNTHEVEERVSLFHAPDL